MTEILDNFNKKENKNYTNKSFRQFIIALSSLVIAIAFVYTKSLNLWNFKYWNSLFLLVSYSYIIFTIRGFINGIRCYTTKEADSTMKRIGIIGNSLLLSLILFSIISNYKLLTSPPKKVENIEELAQ